MPCSAQRSHPENGATAPHPFMPWIYVWRRNNRARNPPLNSDRTRPSRDDSS